MVKINPGIFKAYDIRGIYPSEINEDSFYQIGRAFVAFLKKEKPKIVVARDNRLSSLFLFKSLSKGIMDQGGDVIDIDLSPTPMFYFAVAHFGFDGGIIITASHNPPQYNGLKMVRENAIPISGESGILDIKELANNDFEKSGRIGSLIKKDILKEYVRFNQKSFNFKDSKKLRIVIDTANAVSGVLISEMFENFPFEIYQIFKEMDGSFPNHNPDPLIEENLRFLKGEVKNKKADLGVAFDGDGDRIIFIDERAEVVPGDLIFALLVNSLWKNNIGQKFLYDIRSSNIVKEKIEENGDIPLADRIGHSFIKEKMRKENILFAGEFTGHYYLKDHYYCEVPFFVLFSILKIISSQRKPFSEIMKPFKKYFHSGEINFKVEDKIGKIEKLKNRYLSGKISEVDGVRVDFSDWWFLVRASNTEPVLRLVVEAKTKELMEEKKKELTLLIQG